MKDGTMTNLAEKDDCAGYTNHVADDEAEWVVQASREELMSRIRAQGEELRAYHDLRDRAFGWCRADPMVVDAGATTSLLADVPSEYGTSVSLLTARGFATRAALEIALEVAQEATRRLWEANGFRQHDQHSNSNTEQPA